MRFIFLLLSGVAALIALLRRPQLRLKGNDHVPSPPKGKTWLRCGRGSGPPPASRIIGPNGGTVPLHGHLLTVPAGAVDRDTRFTLLEPPTPQVMVIATCAGPFRGNLSLTISWAHRCRPGEEPNKPRIYRREGVVDLGGRVQGQTITTNSVDHLSGFLIAQG